MIISYIYMINVRPLETYISLVIVLPIIVMLKWKIDLQLKSEVTPLMNRMRQWF